MTLLEQIIATYPELEGQYGIFGSLISLRDNQDGEGAYIAIWEYEKPLTKELKTFYRP